MNIWRALAFLLVSGALILCSNEEDRGTRTEKESTTVSEEEENEPTDEEMVSNEFEVDVKRSKDKDSMGKFEFGYGIESDKDNIKRCYRIWYSSKTRGEGVVAVRYSIAPAGSVKTAYVTEDTVGRKEVRECLLKVARKQQFKSWKGKGEVVAVYTYRFPDNRFWNEYEEI
jgi:hypothetical protein